MRRAAIALACVLSFIGGTYASADGAYARWSRFDRIERAPSRIAHVYIWGRCIDAEDSAAHLILRAYDNDVARYGCAHGGY